MTSQFLTPDRSPMLQVNITKLIDDLQCYQTVRELRWPDGITCPSCQSTEVIKPSSTPAAGRPRAGAAGGGLSGAWEDTGAPAGERLGGTGGGTRSVEKAV